MHTVPLEKPVNLSQLSYELVEAFGGDPPGLRLVAGRKLTLLEDGYPEDLFVDVLNAHQADPDWARPEPEPEPAGFWRRLFRGGNDTRRS